MTQRRYTLIIAPTAKKQLAEELPESVAFAAYEFIIGLLLDNPQRMGKQLRPPLADRHSARRGAYRVLYRIDDERQEVTVVGGFGRPTHIAHDDIRVREVAGRQRIKLRRNFRYGCSPSTSGQL